MVLLLPLILVLPSLSNTRVGFRGRRGIPTEEVSKDAKGTFFRVSLQDPLFRLLKKGGEQIECAIMTFPT